MALSKKHFEAIAKVIDENTPHNDDTKQLLVNAFCNYFKTQNKNFNSFRFYNACFKTFKPLSKEQELAHSKIKWIGGK